MIAGLRLSMGLLSKKDVVVPTPVRKVDVSATVDEIVDKLNEEDVEIIKTPIHILMNEKAMDFV